MSEQHFGFVRLQERLTQEEMEQEQIDRVVEAANAVLDAKGPIVQWMREQGREDIQLSVVFAALEHQIGAEGLLTEERFLDFLMDIGDEYRCQTFSWIKVGDASSETQRIIPMGTIRRRSADAAGPIPKNLEGWISLAAVTIHDSSKRRADYYHVGDMRMCDGKRRRLDSILLVRLDVDTLQVTLEHGPAEGETTGQYNKIVGIRHIEGVSLDNRSHEGLT